MLLILEMDEKDPLSLHVGDQDEVDGQVSLLPSTSDIDISMPTTYRHSIDVPCDVQEDDSQKCIVVVPVEQYQAGQGLCLLILPKVHKNLVTV